MRRQGKRRKETIYMGEDEFWDAIGLLDWGRGGDDVTAVEPLSLIHI